MVTAFVSKESKITENDVQTSPQPAVAMMVSYYTQGQLFYKAISDVQSVTIVIVMCACLGTTCTSGSHRGQKRVWDPLELKLQAV